MSRVRRTQAAIIADVHRKLKRMSKKVTLFRLYGDTIGQWRTVVHVFNPAVKEYLVKKYGKSLDIIANEDFNKAANHELSHMAR